MVWMTSGTSDARRSGRSCNCRRRRKALCFPVLSAPESRTMALNVEIARHNMIAQQVRPWDVLDERVLGTLGALRREDFVTAAQRNLAFADLCLPLGHDEFMMKPVVEGRVLQAVSAQSGESVLEIGTGSGFLTACLARMAGEVVSVEQHADFVD